MSQSTARSTLRAKEVGVRKVSGASKKTIASQFYIESAFFTCLSFILGYVLCYIFKPWFLNVLQLKIDNSFLYSPLVLVLLFGLLLITTIVAGSYPACVLSAFKPVVTLKGKMSVQAGGVTVRKIFTTLQFAIAIGLIICRRVIDRQLFFFRHTDIVLNRNNVVMIPILNSFGKNYRAFKSDVQALAGVDNVATSRYGMFKGCDMYSINGKTKEEDVMLSALTVDNNYIKTLGIKWKYPPSSNKWLTGSKEVVINESAIGKLHLKLNPVGSYIQAGNQKIEVAGVLQNFNFSSMESVI